MMRTKIAIWKGYLGATGIEKDDYCDKYGWDVNTSVPTRSKLEGLELDEFTDSLRVRL